MKDAVKSIAYMFVITLCFTVLVSAVKMANDKRIERNQEIKLQGIILRVLDIEITPDTSDEKLQEIYNQRVKALKVNDGPVYIGYKDDGKTVQGYAFPVGGAGFWGPIYGMVGVGPQASKILGIAFYKHGETPGLGGRISEKWFQEQFKGLKLHPVEGDKKIFYLNPPGTRQGPGELDAITGASNTSKSVEKFLNADLDRFLKETWKSLKEKSGQS